MPSGFDIDPGGFATDLSGEIADVVFMPGQYGTQAIVTIGRDDPFTMSDGTLVNEKTGYYDVDSGFEASGDTLVNPDPSAKITGRSKWGKFCQAVQECGPEAVDAISAAGGGAYSSAGWKGHRFHFEMIGAGEKYDEFTNAQGEVVPAGKKKGLLLPVEYLGTTDAPQSGSVGASAPSSGFDLTVLPDDIIEAWAPLAEATPDNGVFQADVLKSGLLTQEKLGTGYQQVTAALGDGTLRQALSPVV